VFGDTQIVQTTLAVPFALFVWLVVYAVAAIALYCLDRLRGEDGWLQAVFRSLLTPGLGGYAAIWAVGSWLNNANLRAVLWIVCTLMFLATIGLPIYMMLTLPEDWTFSWGDQIMKWLTGASTILGAIVAYKQWMENR